jgi:hypothetical protein
MNPETETRCPGGATRWYQSNIEEAAFILPEPRNITMFFGPALSARQQNIHKEIAELSFQQSTAFLHSYPFVLTEYKPISRIVTYLNAGRRDAETLCPE